MTIDETIQRYSDLVDSSFATYQVKANNESFYEVAISFPNNDGNIIEFQERYELIDGFQMEYFWRN